MTSGRWTNGSILLCPKQHIDPLFYDKDHVWINGRQFISLKRVGEMIDETRQTNADNVNHPTHYTSGEIECIDAIEAATQGLTGIEAVCTGNAIKYLWRWKLKNGSEDLQKARWYIDHLIKLLGGTT